MIPNMPFGPFLTLPSPPITTLQVSNMADFLAFSTNQIATKKKQMGNYTNGKNGVSGP